MFCRNKRRKFVTELTSVYAWMKSEEARRVSLLLIP